MIQRVGLGIGCALGAAAMYGLVPNLVRSAYLNGVPPVESIFFRTSLLAVLFSLLAVIRGERFVIPPQARGSFLAQSAATLVVSICYLASVQFIPVGLAVIIFFLFPVLIMIAAPAIEGQNPGPLRILIAIIAFAGLGIAIGPSFSSLDIRGILLAAVGALAGALQFFSGRSISHYMAPSAFGALVHLAIWPIILGVALLLGHGQLQFLPGGSANAAGISFMSALAGIYVIAYMVQMLSLRFSAASTVAPYYNLEPVVTTGVAALVLGERLTPNQYAGGGIVLAALMISSLLGSPKSIPA